MKRIILVLLCMFSCWKITFSQTDKEFWFAAPEITSTHEDRPIFLRISTYSQAATVTISIPANNTVTPVTFNVPANTTFSQNLSANPTNWIDLLENSGLDAVQNKGLYITSTANINAYYEVLGTRASDNKVLNSDIFPLKGSRALGTKFYTPFQNQLDNATTSDAWSSFDIVATEDNTTITITPTKDIVNHAAGVPFTITLNKGQTYSARATSKTGANHPTGSVIVANKPIAVTVKDDSVVQNAAWDMVGDQLVPVSVIGTDYIVVKGFLNYNGASLGDRAIIVATEDNTVVKVGGVEKVTLAAGQTYNYQVNSGLSAEYINTSQPAYVFHLSGFGDELGGALLPPIECTGSKQVGVIRDTDEPFYLTILVKSGGENNFTLKNTTTGNNITINGGAFTTVPGTPIAGEWKTITIGPLQTWEFPSGSVGVVSNTTNYFHLGLINGNSTGAGARYGYFSDYASLTGGTATATSPVTCEGSTTSIVLTGSVGDIQWQTSPDGTNGWANVTGGSGANSATYTTPVLNTPGTLYYRALLTNGVCTPPSSTLATITVDPKSKGGTATANKDSLCENTSTIVKITGYTGANIQWQDSTTGSTWKNVIGGSGGTTDTYTTPALSKTTFYRAKVTSGVCTVSDFSTTIKVVVSPVTVGGTSAAVQNPVCINSSATVSLTGYTGSIQWQDSTKNGTWQNVTGGTGGQTSSYTTPSLTDTIYYRAVVQSGVCQKLTSNIQRVTVSPISVKGNASVAKSPICINDSTSLTLNGYTGNIQWQDSTAGGNWQNVSGGTGGTSSTYQTPKLTATTYFRAKVTSGACSAVNSDTVKVVVNQPSIVGVTTANPPLICANTTTTVSVNGNPAGALQWQQTADTTITGSWKDVEGGSGAQTTTYTTLPLTSKTFFRAIVSVGGCASSSSTVVTVNVDSVSNAGTLTSAKDSICFNSNILLTLKGYTGNNFTWEQSTDDITWNPIVPAPAGTTFTTPGLTQTTYFRVIVKNGAVCSSDISAPLKIHVDSLSTGGTATANASATSTAICKGSTATVSLSGFRGVPQWEQSADSISWTPIASATDTTFTTTALSSTTYFRAVVNNGVCSSDTSVVVKVQVDSTSSGGVAVAGKSPVCYGDNSVINLSKFKGSVQWQDSTSGTNWQNVSGGNGATTSSYTTPTLTDTIFYRAIVKNGVCIEDTSNSIKVIVNPLPVRGNATTTDSPVCAGNAATVVINGSKGNIEWQESTDGINNWKTVTSGSGVNSATYTTGSLTNTVYLKAVVSSGVCDTLNSNIVKITVDPKSNGGNTIASTTAFCGKGQTTVTLNGYTGSIQWQDSTAGNTWKDISGATDFTFNTPELSVSTYYRAIVKSGVCSEIKSAEAEVLIKPASAGGIVMATPDSLCLNSTTLIALFGHTGTISKWEQSPNGVNEWTTIAGTTAQSFTSPKLTQTTYFRATVQAGDCPSATSIIGKANLYPDPGFTTFPLDTNICEETQFVLRAKEGFTNYLWQDGKTTTPYFLVFKPGTYTVKAIDKHQCPVSATSVVGNCKNPKDIPDIFTPNGDGKNDKFVIQGLLPNSSLEVYNRWGNVIYSKAEYDNSWDGDGLVDGVYYYIYKPSDGKTKNGFVHIIR